MPKLKPGTIMPTDAEDEAIRKGIAADPDTFEPSEAGKRKSYIGEDGDAKKLDAQFFAEAKKGQPPRR